MCTYSPRRCGGCRPRRPWRMKRAPTEGGRDQDQSFRRLLGDLQVTRKWCLGVFSFGRSDSNVTSM